MKKIDLTQILKNYPEGTPLYSPLLGKVALIRIDSINRYPITVRDAYGFN